MLQKETQSVHVVFSPSLKTTNFNFPQKGQKENEKVKHLDRIRVRIHTANAHLSPDHLRRKEFEQMMPAEEEGEEKRDREKEEEGEGEGKAVKDVEAGNLNLGLG